MAVVVREATGADIPAMVALGGSMFPLSAFAALTTYDHASVAATLYGLLASPEGCALVAEEGGAVRGLVLAVIAPLYFQRSVRVLSELAWFVVPEWRTHGVGWLLLGALERWAEDHAVDVLHLSTLAACPEVGTSYCARGYIPHEHSFIRRCVWPH